MKTFRLVSMQLLLLQDNEISIRIVPLEEGLIINREEKDKSWLIEAVVEKDEEEFFQKKYESNETVVLEVIITDRHNDPALLTGNVRNVVKLSNTISIMLDAKMAASKDDVSNLILEGLIEDGYTGNDLIKEFTKRKEDQVRWSIKLAERMYHEQLDNG